MGVPTDACAESVFESCEPLSGDTAVDDISSSCFSSTFVGWEGTYVCIYTYIICYCNCINAIHM